MEGAFSAHAVHKVKAKELGGEILFPKMHDVSKGVVMNQSADICDYLWQEYGHNVTKRPATDKLLNGGKLPSLINFALLTAPSGLRFLPSHGLFAAPSKQPVEPLVLEGCEPDADSRLAREVLCCLQLPYYSAQKYGGARLTDPNVGNGEGAVIEGGEKIVQHLDTEYRLGRSLPCNAPAPNPNLGDEGRRSWLATPVEMLFPPRKQNKIE